MIMKNVTMTKEIKVNSVERMNNGEGSMKK